MCYSLFAALFSKTFFSHPTFKYPRSAPAVLASVEYISKQQGNLFEHAQDKSAWTRGNCVCLREIYKPKNIRKNEGSLFAVFYSSTKLIIHFFFLVPTRKKV